MRLILRVKTNLCLKNTSHKSGHISLKKMKFLFNAESLSHVNEMHCATSVTTVVVIFEVLVQSAKLLMCCHGDKMMRLGDAATIFICKCILMRALLKHTHFTKVTHNQCRAARLNLRGLSALGWGDSCCSVLRFVQAHFYKRRVSDILQTAHHALCVCVREQKGQIFMCSLKLVSHEPGTHCISRFSDQIKQRWGERKKRQRLYWCIIQ